MLWYSVRVSLHKCLHMRDHVLYIICYQGLTSQSTRSLLSTARTESSRSKTSTRTHRRRSEAWTKMPSLLLLSEMMMVTSCVCVYLSSVYVSVSHMHQMISCMDFFVCIACQWRQCLRIVAAYLVVYLWNRAGSWVTRIAPVWCIRDQEHDLHRSRWHLHQYASVDMTLSDI